MAEITSTDCAVLAKYPNAPENSWSELLTPEDRDAYVRTHRTLKSIVEDGSEISHGLVPFTTSGFSEKSGIRNQRPKDLWCALANPQSDAFVRMPQIFMIASERGVELGFAAAIHRSDFSNVVVKQRLRSVIPTLFQLFPDPQSNLIKNVEADLNPASGWQFRRKCRLLPGTQEFPTLASLVADLKDEEGLRRGAASVSRYFRISDLDNPLLSLRAAFREATQIFSPLMIAVRERYVFGEDQIQLDSLLVETNAEGNAEKAGAFNPNDAADGRRRILQMIAQRQGQGPFRLRLLSAYDGRCALTGVNVPQALDAAHIYAYDGPQTNHVSNGILLRSDLHTLFDLGLMAINPDYSVETSPKLKGSDYAVLQGKKLTLPNDKNAWPSQKAIEWHYQKVFRAKHN